MKNTNVVDSKEKKTLMDWSSPQWVICGNNIILTTGKHKESSFEGTVLPCKNYPDGKMSSLFFKEGFKPLIHELTIVISN